MHTKHLLILCLSVTMILTACGASPEVKSTQTAQASTSTAAAWTPTPSETPKPDLLPILKNQLESYLNNSNDVQSLQVCELSRDSLKIEMTSVYLAKDMQETLAFEIVSNISLALGIIPEEGLKNTFDLDTFAVILRIDSADDSYHYTSETNIATLQELGKKQIDKAAWVSAAHGRFVFE